MSLVAAIGAGATCAAGMGRIWALVAALVDGCSACGRSGSTGVLIRKKAFISAIFNGVTLAGLYFLVASGFTLVFGLMRNVNLAHGSLYLLGAYIGYEVAQWTDNWFLGVGAGALAIALVGRLLQVFVFQRLAGDELRQTLVTIGISIVAADLMLAIWGGKTYQFAIPAWLDGAIATPIITAIKSNGQIVTMRYPLYRLVVLAAAIVDRRRAVADAQQDAHWHDDPRRRRRSRDAVGTGVKCACCSSACSRSAACLPASPASSAAPRFRSRPAKTCVI